jgi:LEA14-like dessication related protein
MQINTRFTKTDEKVIINAKKLNNLERCTLLKIGIVRHLSDDTNINKIYDAIDKVNFEQYLKLLEVDNESSFILLVEDISLQLYLNKVDLSINKIKETVIEIINKYSFRRDDVE